VPEFYDSKYGRVVVRKNRLSKSIKFSISPKGNLQISAPLYVPMSAVRLLMKRSARDITKLISETKIIYSESQQIGRSHRLVVIIASVTKIYYKKPIIYAEVTSVDELCSLLIQQNIRKYVIKALTVEAKAYLPRRLHYIASDMKVSYKKIRFSHAKSRWGSYSSQGVVSLNIALMKLNHELIDYVLIHELAHITELNHSSAFWSIVKQYCPDYAKRRKKLKNYSPNI
jgi:predicted metal-dependent hydrolase